MLDKEEVRLTAQIMAIEHLLTKLFAELHVRKGRSLHDAKKLHQLMLAQAQLETFPKIDPALSDYAAGEYQTELERLLHGIESILEGPKAQ